jgi:hypothetical protein
MYFGVGNAAASAFSIYNQGEYHNEKLRIEQKQHEDDLSLMRKHHASDLSLAKQTYLIAAFTEIEQYCQELNENLLVHSKDSERDMADQRNHQYFTMMIAGTIMVSSLMTVMIQGTLVTNIDTGGASTFVIIAYSVCNSISLVLLLVSLVLCIEVTTRVNKFMYVKADGNMKLLRNAMAHGRIVTADIKFGSNRFADSRQASFSYSPESRRDTASFEERVHSICNNDNINSTNSTNSSTRCGADGDASRITEDMSHVSHRTGSFSEEEDKGITNLSRNEVDVEFRHHEKQVHRYLETRRLINEDLDSVATRRYRRTFMQYWLDHCQHIGLLATSCFYMGTSFMLLATMLYVWDRWVHTYRSRRLRKERERGF